MQPAAFRISEPRRGYGYVQATGTDTPVFWDVQFRFSADEAVVFQLWFRNLIGRGVDEFEMPLRTEFGLITHTCRFLPDSLLPVDEQGDTWGYRATIMARAQVVPAGYDDAAELIVCLPDWMSWSELLDQAITVEMLAS
jgi:hypothetical protein